MTNLGEATIITDIFKYDILIRMSLRDGVWLLLRHNLGP